MTDIALEFQKAAGIKVRSAVLGAKLTTFNIGGPLQYLIEPEDTPSLQKAVRFLIVHKQQFKIIGAGSNLLIADQGLSGWFILLGSDFRYLKQINETKIQVGAAQGLMPLSKNVSDQGLAGLEFAGGIPGSIGGAVVMNAGAHGHELAEVLNSITVINGSAEIFEIPAKELKPSYRKGGVPADCVVLSAEINLMRSTAGQTSASRAEHLAYRKRTQPLQAPSAGSVFRNPSSAQSAGFLIEQCGLKGRHSGDVLVSELHANWIINPKKSGKASDVKILMQNCLDQVKEKFSIELQTEVVMW
jgi:UDP-N-acetylmuramate dehydrogenase